MVEAGLASLGPRSPVVVCRGTPGGLTRSLPPPQCAPGGCLMELCIQLSIIMLGKQLIQNNLFEIGIP